MIRHAKVILGLMAITGAALIGAVVLFSPFDLAEKTPTKDPMRIATYFWPGMFWVDIARSKGWFEDAGLTVTFFNANPDYYGAVDDVREGRLDTVTVWLFDVMQMNREDSQAVSMVLATDESRGSEALVSSPDIDRVDQLAGKRIGVPLGSALAYALDIMLSRHGLRCHTGGYGGRKRCRSACR